jgi:mRNA interferase YafQ
MRRIEYSSTFKRDYKRSMKRGFDMAKFDNVVELLINNKPLPAKNRPHMLTGEWRGFHECHIAPDWLLIYDLDDPEVLALHRMGTHSDLFE